MITNFSNLTNLTVNHSHIITSQKAYYVCLFQNSNQFIFFILLFVLYSYLIFEIVNSLSKQKLSYKIYTEFIFGFLVVLFFALQPYFSLFCIVNFVLFISLIIVNSLIRKKLNLKKEDSLLDLIKKEFTT